MKLKRKRMIKVKTKKLVNSFKYAIEGFKTSFKTERNMKIHILIMLFVILLGFLLKINYFEWIICIILFSIVIAGELFNTVIETVVDMITPFKNENAKKAKDIAKVTMRMRKPVRDDLLRYLQSSIQSEGDKTV